MSKHLADKTEKTDYIEMTYWTIFSDQTPDRNGRHRAEVKDADA